MNTSCEIYATHIRKLRDNGSVEALAEMVETWYTRCGFEDKRAAITGAGVCGKGSVWIQTSEGRVEYCWQRDRWRMVEHDAAGECRYLFSMFRIAEITQVPWGYLCGIRDALVLSDRKQCAEASHNLKLLSSQLEDLARKVRDAEAKLKAATVKAKKVEAMCSVANASLQVKQTESQQAVLTRQYPEAPTARMSWEDVRIAYKGTPGVYFVWSGDRIVYVGATKKGMYERLTSGHDNATKADTFSFLEIDEHEVYFAEAVYIARHAPVRNAIVASVIKAQKGARHGGRKDRSDHQTVQVGR